MLDSVRQGQANAADRIHRGDSRRRSVPERHTMTALGQVAGQGHAAVASSKNRDRYGMSVHSLSTKLGIIWYHAHAEP